MGAILFVIGTLTGYCLCLYTHRKKAGQPAPSTSLRDQPGDQDKKDSNPDIREGDQVN
jgi:hypothetical protein